LWLARSLRRQLACPLYCEKAARVRKAAAEKQKYWVVGDSWHFLAGTSLPVHIDSAGSGA
jgi:hypothetical protein